MIEFTQRARSTLIRSGIFAGVNRKSGTPSFSSAEEGFAEGSSQVNLYNHLAGQRGQLSPEDKLELGTIHHINYILRVLEEEFSHGEGRALVEKLLPNGQNLPNASILIANMDAVNKLVRIYPDYAERTVTRESLLTLLKIAGEYRQTLTELRSPEAVALLLSQYNREGALLYQRMQTLEKDYLIHRGAATNDNIWLLGGKITPMGSYKAPNSIEVTGAVKNRAGRWVSADVGTLPAPKGIESLLTDEIKKAAYFEQGRITYRYIVDWTPVRTQSHKHYNDEKGKTWYTYTYHTRPLIKLVVGFEFADKTKKPINYLVLSYTGGEKSVNGPGSKSSGAKALGYVKENWTSGAKVNSRLIAKGNWKFDNNDHKNILDQLPDLGEEMREEYFKILQAAFKIRQEEPTQAKRGAESRVERLINSLATDIGEVRRSAERIGGVTATVRGQVASAYPEALNDDGLWGIIYGERGLPDRDWFGRFVMRYRADNGTNPGRLSISLYLLQALREAQGYNDGRLLDVWTPGYQNNAAPFAGGETVEGLKARVAVLATPNGVEKLMKDLDQSAAIMGTVPEYRQFPEKDYSLDGGYIVRVNLSPTTWTSSLSGVLMKLYAQNPEASVPLIDEQVERIKAIIKQREMRELSQKQFGAVAN